MKQLGMQTTADLPPSRGGLTLPVATTSVRDETKFIGSRLLLLLAVLSPWGQVLRLQNEGPLAGQGGTTILAVMVIALAVMTKRWFLAIFARPAVLFYAGFIVLGVIATWCQSAASGGGVSSGISLGGYWAFMVAIMSLSFGQRDGRVFLRVFAVSTALMSLVAMADYYGFANVPRFNEQYSGFTTGSLHARSLIGPFASRTIMAVHLALAWPVPLMELLHTAKSAKRLSTALWSILLLVLTLAVFLCYSRGLYLTLAFCGFYGLWSIRSGAALKSFVVTVLLGGFFAVFQALNPKGTMVLLNRIASLSPENMIESGGYHRSDAFWLTLDGLRNDPLGLGFGILEETGLNTHSVFTVHLRIAGPIGFLLVCLFVWLIFAAIVNRRGSVDDRILSAAIVGVLAYGVAHEVHMMMGLWAVFGFLLSRPLWQHGAARARFPSGTPLCNGTGIGGARL